MRRALHRLPYALFLALVVSGCMKVENGLGSPDETDAIFNPELVGEWTFPEQRPEEQKYISAERDAPGSKAYRVTLGERDKDGRPVGTPIVCKVFLVKLGDTFFLDALPPAEQGAREQLGHFLMRAELRPGEIGLRGLSEEFVKEHPQTLRRTLEKGFLGLERVRVTATRAELTGFARQHARDEAAWNSPEQVLRHR
jgi:hypothetical protein